MARIRKSVIILIGLVVYSIILLIAPYIFADSFLNVYLGFSNLVINLGVFLFLLTGGIYFLLDEQEISTKEISFIAIFSAFTSISRIPFLAVPNVQPCTFLIFCAGLVFGPLMGWIIGSNVAFLSNFIVGHGPWTVFQVIGWGCIGIFGGILKNIYTKRRILSNRYFLASCGFIVGFLYGWLLNFGSLPFLTTQFSWSGYFALCIQSFFFDLAHAIGNTLFLFFLGPRTLHVLERYHYRFLVRYDQPRENQPIEQKRKEKSGD